MSAAANRQGLPVAVIIGATSKWQSDGRNTRLVAGSDVDDSDVPVASRWSVGGALALRFAAEGYFTVMTTRVAANAAALARALADQGGQGMVVELDLASRASVAAAFARIRAEAGDPDIVIYNAGYLEGRDLPKEEELLEFFPEDQFETAIDISCRGPFWVAKEVLPAMRAKGRGSFFFSNNPSSLRGRKRRTGQSLYYPRVLMRTLAQALTEEYSEHGVHVANVIIDGGIDSPGARVALRAARLMDPAKIADAFYYLHTQDPSVWSHEIQLTPSHQAPAF